MERRPTLDEAKWGQRSGDLTHGSGTVPRGVTIGDFLSDPSGGGCQRDWEEVREMVMAFRRKNHQGAATPTGRSRSCRRGPDPGRRPEGRPRDLRRGRTQSMGIIHVSPLPTPQ